MSSLIFYLLIDRLTPRSQVVCGRASKAHYAAYATHCAALRQFLHMLRVVFTTETEATMVRLVRQNDTHYVLEKIPSRLSARYPGCLETDTLHLRYNPEKRCLTLVCRLVGVHRRSLVLRPIDDRRGHIRGCAGRLSYRALPLELIRDELDFPWPSRA